MGNSITNMVVKLSRTHAGTVVMWFMVFLSLVSIALIIERFIFFARNKGNIRGLRDQLTPLLAKGDWEGCRTLLEQSKGFESNVVLAALDGVSSGPTTVKELSSSATLVEKLRFERFLAFLGTLGNNAPFIGLFGTVLEIIAALFELGTQSGANASAGAVMSQLSAALAATAVGLLVALPAVAAYNTFMRRIKSMQTGADALVHLILAKISEDKSNTVNT